jgi:hypothetical protein
MPKSKQFNPNDTAYYLPGYQRMLDESVQKLEEKAVIEMIGELSSKIDELSAKLDLIFGKSLLINGRFRTLKL